MTLTSALYAGEVIHNRLRPKVHKLRYRVFSLLLDLDELEGLNRKLKLFGHNRRAVFSFHDSDHGSGERNGLKDWVRDQLENAGLWSPEMRIAVLCYPRIFGYAFNPLTVYFCRTADGELRAILYEVSNTFHERHTYVIPTGTGRDGQYRHECAKEMYVSPFIPMDCRYRFRIAPPSERVLIAINEADTEGPLLHASFSGRRRPLSDRTLLKALTTYPLMTLKIMGAIHFEALLLWLKGISVYRHRAATRPIDTTVVASHRLGEN
ncbi:DUF1365 family protein [uncultured Roseibium sp.]|uniref:DUF1365 domain-containing protein n=1 Tax=uncultured Roseibium sp. TaxID=1936171 RepID=UPI003216CDF0